MSKLKQPEYSLMPKFKGFYVENKFILGLLENVYEEALADEFELRRIPYERQEGERLKIQR